MIHLLLKNLFDIAFNRCPAIVFEPVFFWGIIGLFALILNPPKTYRRILFLFCFLGCIVVSWRLFFYSNMVSKRYFEILLIPFIILAAYGCNCVKLFSNFIYKKNNVFQENTTNIVFICLIAVIISWEISELQRTDFYHWNIIQAISEYTRWKSNLGKVAVLSNFKMEENRRINYYLPREMDTIKEYDEEDFYTVLNNTPNILFYKEIIVITESRRSHDITLSKNTLLNHRIKKKLLHLLARNRRDITSSYVFPQTEEESELIDPSLIEGKNKYNMVDKKNFTLKNASLSFNNAQSIITGQYSQVFSKDFIPVTLFNRLDLSVRIKNTGNSSAKIYVGYAFYDKNKKPIGADSFPERHKNIVLTVLSAPKDQNHINVDKEPQWRKQCIVAINAMDDLSDIPNTCILDSVVQNLVKQSSNEITIELNKPLKHDILPGTKIRIHNIPGAFIYENITTLLPNKTFSCKSSIAKYESFPFYTPKAIPKGVFFVKPLILSYSTNGEKNSIEISQWEITY